MVQSLSNYLSLHGVPLQLGAKVTVDESFQYANEWQGEYVVLGVRWDRAYEKVNVTIGDNLDDPGCDGWEPIDLKPVVEK